MYELNLFSTFQNIIKMSINNTNTPMDVNNQHAELFSNDNGVTSISDSN